MPNFFSLHISIEDDCRGGDHVKTYIVQRGDSLWLISRKYGISLDSLIAANTQITNPDLINVGDNINIPIDNSGETVNLTSPMSDPQLISFTPTTQFTATHTVVAGDTMWFIANKYGVSLDALIAANPQITNPDVINIGMIINIPSGGVNPPINQSCPTTYTVQAGDTMWQIARKSGVTLEALINANPNIPNPNAIQIGQQICIPNANMPYVYTPNVYKPTKKSKGHKPTMPPVPPIPTTMPTLPIPPLPPMPTMGPCPTMPPITIMPLPPIPHLPTFPPMPTVCPVLPAPPMHPMPTFPIMPTQVPLPMPYPQIQYPIPCKITVHHMHHICGCCSPYKPRMY